MWCGRFAKTLLQPAANTDPAPLIRTSLWPCSSARRLIAYILERATGARAPSCVLPLRRLAFLANAPQVLTRGPAKFSSTRCGHPVNYSTSDWWAVAFCLGLLLIRQAISGIDLLSLMVLVPLLVCLIPTLDSLQRRGMIRIWDKWTMRFTPVEKDSSPFSYWLNLIVSWPATVFFSYALVMMPKR